MFDYINSFFESEFAKNNVVAIIVSIILLIGIGAVAMWFFMSKIYNKIELNKNHELKNQVKNLEIKNDMLQQELTEVKKNRDDLLEQNDKLKFYDEYEKVEKREKDEQSDEALDAFVN